MSDKDAQSQYAEYLLYKEKPVSIDEFIVSPEFMGNMTECGKAVWPRWRKELEDIANNDAKYVTVLTGSIGGGKTSTSILALAYTLYKLMCRRNPRASFKKMQGNNLYIAFFNLTKTLSDSRGYGAFQKHLVSSPWFCARGTVAGSDENPRLYIPGFDCVVASPLMKGFGIQGLDIIGALLDEVDSPDASPKSQKRVLDAYNSAIRRLETRFVYQGKTPGRFFVVASKQDRLSFLNTFIAKMSKSSYVRVIDLSIWEAKRGSEEGEYCGKMFQVSIGDEYHLPTIIETDDDLKNAQKAGFSVIEVPIEYREQFETDIVGSLRDLGGISVSHGRRTKLFPSESIISKCMDETNENPLTMPTIKIGLKDKVSLVDFIDFNKIHIDRSVPRFIHQDYAYADGGDASGVAMSCVIGWKKTTITGRDGISRVEKMPVVYTDFVMRLVAKPGDVIPQHLVRQFFLDLKEMYKFNIVKCTFDLRMGSHQSMQALELAGIDSDHLSVDIKPDNYLNFRDMVFDGRWSTPMNQYLMFELKHLEHDTVKHKIDHPDEVSEIQFLDDGGTKQVIMVGSKDLSDAVVGSVIASLNDTTDPPDMEIMRDVIKRSLPRPDIVQDDLYNILDIKSTTEPPQKKGERTMGDKDMLTYKDLLNRVKRNT